jgi:hypothetical protein
MPISQLDPKDIIGVQWQLLAPSSPPTPVADSGADGARESGATGEAGADAEGAGATAEAGADAGEAGTAGEAGVTPGTITAHFTVSNVAFY